MVRVAFFYGLKPSEASPRSVEHALWLFSRETCVFVESWCHVAFFPAFFVSISHANPNAISAWRERRRLRRHTRSAGHSLGVQIRAVGPAGDPAVPLLGRCGEGACVHTVDVRRRTCH